MKSKVIALIKAIAGEIRKNMQQLFPSSKSEFGLAFIEDVEEVPIKESIFKNKQLVLCDDIPSRVEYYLVFVYYNKEHHKVKSHQIYSRNTEVGIEYFRKKMGRIQIVRIFNKSLLPKA